MRTLTAGLRWRLPAVAIAVSAAALALALAPPRALEVDAASLRAPRVFRAFGAPLLRQQRAGRWSGPDSVIVLHGAPAGESVLILRIASGTSGRPQTVSLAAADGGRRVVAEPATLTVGPEWQDYIVRLKIPSWPPSLAPVEVALGASPYRRGAEGEQLGVRVGGLSLRSTGGVLARLAAAAPVVAAWSWGLALLAVGVTRVARRVTARAEVAGAMATAVAGLVLAAWAWRDAWGMAWSLPPPLWVLGLVTVLLLLTPEANGPPGVDAGRGSSRAEPWAWALGLGALLVLYLQRGGVWLPGLVLAGALAVVVARSRGQGAPPGERAAPPRRRNVLVAMALVVLAALAMRFASIRDLPYGLWRDEARYGLVALRMIEDPSYRPAYVPEVVTLPGLGLRMLGVGLQVWGIASWSMRTVPALAGALTVIPLFGLARRLTGRGDVALLAAAFLAASSWHVTVSRITSPAAMHPLFELLGLWCLVAALGIGRDAPPRAGWQALFLAAGGACLGVSLQTYHSGRSSPLVAAALFAAAWTARPPLRPRWHTVVVVALGFAATAAPFLAYAWRDAPRLNARVGAVFLPAAAAASAIPPTAALDASVGRHLLMFNLRGDQNGRRNIPYRPMLDPVTGLGFLAGLLVLWRARHDPGPRFVLLALAVGLVPSGLAVEGPHALRAIGAASYACIAAAVGWRDLATRVARLEGGRATAVLVAAGMAALAFGAWSYFVVAPHDARVWGSFYPVETRVGGFVRDLARCYGPDAAARVHLSRETGAESVTEFLVHGLPVMGFDRESPAPDALFVVARESDREQLFALAAARGLGAPRPAGDGPLLPDGVRPAFTLYRLPAR